MNYKEIYNKLMDKAREEHRVKGGEVYYELHHITPRSCGGDDGENNLVHLTWREHLLSHKLLCKIYKSNDNYLRKMQYALNRMLCGSDTKRCRKGASDILRGLFDKHRDNISVINTFLALIRVIPYNNRTQHLTCGILLYAGYTTFPDYFVCRIGGHPTGLPVSSGSIKIGVNTLVECGALTFHKGYSTLRDGVQVGMPSIACLTDKGRNIVEKSFLFYNEKGGRHDVSKYITGCV